MSKEIAKQLLPSVAKAIEVAMAKVVDQQKTGAVDFIPTLETLGMPYEVALLQYKIEPNAVLIKYEGCPTMRVELTTNVAFAGPIFELTPDWIQIPQRVWYVRWRSKQDTSTASPPALIEMGPYLESDIEDIVGFIRTNPDSYQVASVHRDLRVGDAVHATHNLQFQTKLAKYKAEKAKTKS